MLKSTDASLCEVNLIMLHTTEDEFHSNDLPVVRRGGQIALPNNSGGVKDGLYVYFAIYRQLIVD
jgi:hypothetical protein